MKTIATSYREFSALVQQEHILRDTTISYETLCARLRVSPPSLNEILEKELGMKGQEILDCLRNLLNL